MGFLVGLLKQLRGEEIIFLKEEVELKLHLTGMSWHSQKVVYLRMRMPAPPTECWEFLEVPRLKFRFL